MPLCRRGGAAARASASRTDQTEAEACSRLRRQPCGRWFLGATATPPSQTPSYCSCCSRLADALQPRTRAPTGHPRLPASPSLHDRFSDEIQPRATLALQPRGHNVELAGLSAYQSLRIGWTLNPFMPREPTFTSLTVWCRTRSNALVAGRPRRRHSMLSIQVWAYSTTSQLD